nr:hypothetical protein [Bacillota bacterium]
VDLREELRSLYFDALLLQKIDCSREDNEKYRQLLKNNEPLPNGVYEYKISGVDEYKMPAGEGSGTFYTIYQPELTQEEKLEYITFKQLKMISTIKSCVVFFATLTAISLAITAIAVISLMSNM